MKHIEGETLLLQARFFMSFMFLLSKSFPIIILLIFVNSCKSLRVLYNFSLILPYYTSDMAGLRPCSRQSRGVIC